MSKYDVIISRQGGESVGYMCAWGESADSPMSVISDSPDIPISTSTGITQAGGAFSARDASPPYPIEVNNWQGGAGQKSYDHEQALDSAFLKSRRMDVTQEGQFGLGPNVLVIDDTTMKNVAGFALGTFWAGFTPLGEGTDRNQLRYLARLDTASTSDSGYWLAGTSDTALKLSSYENMTDLSLGTTTLDLTSNDLLYSPSTGEIIKVSSGSAGSYVVARAQHGTTATAHAALEQWVLLRWVPVTYTDTGPTQLVTAIATDGEYVYASFHTAGSDNGSVWKGKPNATDWTSYSVVTNIVDLHFCAGYLYGAQDKYATSTRTTVGYFASGTFTPISLSGALTPQMNTAGLTSVANYAYWGVTDGFSSAVYRVQHSSENLFELVAIMPPGFVLTDLKGHLGNLYAGGYIDTLATTAHDTDMPQYEGALYIVGADNVVARLFRIKDASDARVKGLSVAGPYILCLTNEDVYLYDTSTGGYSHYAQVPTNTETGETSGLDWTTTGFYWDFPVAGTWHQNFMTSYATWDVDVDGDIDTTFIAETYATGHDTVKVYNTDYQQWSCDAGKWYRVTISGLPTTQGTLEWKCDVLRSNAACVVVGMDDKEVRVHLRGRITDGTVVNHDAFLGYTTDPACDVDEYEYTQTSALPVAEHTYRLTFGGFGAKLYVDGVEGASTEYNQLRNADDDNAISFAVGWPGDPGSDTNLERVRWTDMRFTAEGAYPPEYVGGALITTSMKDIASAQGISIVPVPADSWALIDQQAQTGSGYLELSESALHMGSVLKYFVKVTVEHTPLMSGQTIAVTPLVDGVATGSASGVTATKITDAIIGAQGRSIRTRIDITDDNPARPYSDRLRPTCVTSRFFTVNSPHLHQMALNCRMGVQCRNGKDWDYDPEVAIRHAYAAADSGEVVTVFNAFTNEGENETQNFRIESAKLVLSPGDNIGYDRPCGTLVLKMRRVDE